MGRDKRRLLRTDQEFIDLSVEVLEQIGNNEEAKKSFLNLLEYLDVDETDLEDKHPYWPRKY